jgi:16S rRNA (guanine527-N7)-methyltransferase
MMFSAEHQLLVNGSQQLGLDLKTKQVEDLLAYLRLLDKWNHAFNLSAIREPSAMVKLHLLDSLSIAPLLEGDRLIDVGTGGGLPGIPLAIKFPKKSFTLLDSAGKKTRFLFQVKQELGLENVTIQNCRVEQYQPEELYDGVISRAFASLQDMLKGCAHLIREDGRFWAMKGQIPYQELKEIEPQYTVEHCHSLSVPGVEAQRCLLVIRQGNKVDLPSNP